MKFVCFYYSFKKILTIEQQNQKQEYFETFQVIFSYKVLQSYAFLFLSVIEQSFVFNLVQKPHPRMSANKGSLKKLTFIEKIIKFNFGKKTASDLL